MTAEELLEELRRRGATVTAEAGELHIVAPRGALTIELRQDLAGRKPELLALLAGGMEPIDWTADPRPDLAEDTHLWARLLAMAYPIDGDNLNGLFGALHGFRCGGARLRLRKATGMLEPGELGAEYAELRAQYLAPHSEALIGLLRDLAAAAVGKAA